MPTPPTLAVLLLQLGTPDAPERGAVRRYLAQFLADPRVVDLPRWQWLPLLHGIILRTRPARSAALYRTIWRADGVSPLLHHTRLLASRIQHSLGGGVRVVFAMRYGSPAIGGVVEELRDSGVERLLVLPLFPQYASSTTGSALEAVLSRVAGERVVPALRVVPPFFDDPGYVAALARGIRAVRDPTTDPDAFYLFSFHGLPQRHADLGDPYPRHCTATAAALGAALDLPEERWLVTFQSRFGREPWLQPYTDLTLEELPGRGIRRVVAACPGFVADCLETLEEIAVQNRERFLAAGGEEFTYVPCLNTGEEWLGALEAIIRRELAGWAWQGVAAAPG